MSDYSLNIGNLPTGFCPTTYQSMLSAFGQAMSVSIPSASGISISATPPPNTSAVWFQIDSLNRFIRMFTYAQGSWLSAHPLPPGSTIWWFSALPNFSVFDGGDSFAPGVASGAMWQQATVDGTALGTVISAQFPVTAGTLPSGKVLAVGGSGGEENHTLLTAEIPLHQHKSGVATFYEFGAYGSTSTDIPGGQAKNSIASVVTGTPIYQPLTAVDGGGGGGHNTMPPYVVGYLLQRTYRQFYSVT